MNAPATKGRPRPPVGGGAFYGWWIVVATFVVGFLVAGGTVNAFGVLVKPIAESLNVGRAELGAVITVKLAVNALLSPWVGSLLARRSIRGIMLTGAAAMGLGLATAAFAQSLWPIYLGLGVLAGVAGTAALFLPCIALVSNWFTRLRGRALGLATLGPTLSGVVIPVLLSPARRRGGLEREPAACGCRGHGRSAARDLVLRAGPSGGPRPASRR